jgi:hypothetical protein
MHVPIQAPPVHRNWRSRPFESVGYWSERIGGVRLAQNGQEGMEEEDEEHSGGAFGEEES